MKSAITVLSTACCAAAVLGIAAQARALTTSAAAAPVSYNGTCPATIALNGTISGGNPGAGVQYMFYYLDPSTGKGVGMPMQTGTLDSSGSLQLSNAISLDAQHTGSSWVRLIAQQAGGSTADSGNAAFSVACTSNANAAQPALPSAPSTSLTATTPDTGAPQQGNSLTRGLISLFVHSVVPHRIAAPRLRLTNNVADCTRHVLDATAAASVPFTCHSALDAGKGVIVWDFALGTLCPLTHVCPPIEGYHIYDVTAVMVPGARGVRGTLIDTQPKDVTLSSPSAGKCFAVAAYVGSDESPMSNVVCLP